MSYEPLHHKYRPQTFQDLVGQEAISSTLMNAIELGKIAPAYLFTGSRGTGKTSSARIFAKSLNCFAASKPTATPCGECEVCRAIAIGNALDVIEIDAASNTGVDNIREIIERSRFAPVQSRYKVYAIDECLAGDTLIRTSEGWMRIDNPDLKGKMVLSYNENTKVWEYKKVLRWLERGIKETLVIKTDLHSKAKIRCTGNHLIATQIGWLEAKNIQEKMKIIFPDMFNNVSWIDNNANDTQYLRQCLPCNTLLAQVEYVYHAGREIVYDLEVEDNHNFVANGLLVHNCHMLSTAAFNALLKTLEEPPPRVVFILATTDPQRVLPTIISRCQRFDYRRIPLDAMVKHLQYIAEQEKIAINLEALTLVGQIANGGLRDAESLLDQLSLFPDTITVERVWDLVGVVPERDLLALLIAIRKQDVEAILTQCRSLLDKGREPLVLLQNLASFYLNLLITKTAPSRQDLIAVTETCRQQLVDEAQYWDVGQILQGQQHLKEGEVQIKNTTQPRLWLEVILLGLLERAVVSEKGKQQLLLPSQPNFLVSANKQDEVFENIAQNNLERKVVSFPNSNIIEQEFKSNFSGETLIVAKEDKEVISISPQQSINNVEIEIDRETKEQEFTLKSSLETSVKEQIAPDINSKDLVSTSQQATIWQQVINCIHPPITQALLRQQCHLISLNDSNAVVGISSAPLLKMNQGKIPNIEVAFAKVCQRKIKVFLEVSPLPEEVKKNSNSLDINSFQPSVKIDSEARERSQFSSNSTSIKTDLEPIKIQEVTEDFIPIQEDNLTLPLRDNTELAIEEQSDLTSVNTSEIENSDYFIKAVELIAKKFDGEIIELRDSFKITASSDKETKTQENITKPHQVIIKREAIVDCDDDVPF